MGFLSGITSFVKEHSDVIHGVLDVAGFIPGVGAVADLANAGLYAAEGNWLEAGLSLASAVPGIGDTIALAKKSGKALKGLKGLKSLKGLKGFNALDKAKGMKSLFGALKGKAKTGASKVKGWLKKPKEAFNNIKKRLKGECVNGRCFTGDTLVYTRHGYKPIKGIQKGDEVYSRNAETGETGFREVEEVFCTTAHTIYHVWIDGKEEIKTTAYHPVYVEGQGWVTAIDLREGDAIETVDGMVCITKIVKERHEEPVPVYNFHVKEWASYFVGEVRVYVHNGKERHITSKHKKKYKSKTEKELPYRKEAMMEAKKRIGVPRCQQPKRQWVVGGDARRANYKNYKYVKDNPTGYGRYYEYDTPDGIRVVVDHTSHKEKGLHFHTGQPKGKKNINSHTYDFKKEKYLNIRLDGEAKDRDYHIYYRKSKKNKG